MSEERSAWEQAEQAKDELASHKESVQRSHDTLRRVKEAADCDERDEAISIVAAVIACLTEAATGVVTTPEDIIQGLI